MDPSNITRKSMLVCVKCKNNICYKHSRTCDWNCGLQMHLLEKILQHHTNSDTITNTISTRYVSVLYLFYYSFRYNFIKANQPIELKGKYYWGGGN